MESSTNDFFSGAATVVGLVGVYKVWQLFQSPSLKKIEKTCSKPLANMGDNDKVTVWGFEETDSHPYYDLGITDDSPYVIRVEAYLRLIKQPYHKAESKGMTENPRGKVPFCNIKGQMVDDSSKILAALENTFDVQLDKHLTQDQLVTGHLIRQMLFGSLYFVMLHQTFELEAGRQTFRDYMATKMPPVIRNLVSALVFRSMHACLYGSGIGRMSHADIVKKGQADVRSLSRLLGKKKYFFGDKEPTSYDSDVYAWLVMLFHDKAQNTNAWVEDIAKECSNLVEHTERMRALLFVEQTK